MIHVTWPELLSIRPGTNCFWVKYRIPLVREEWFSGVFMSCHLNLPVLDGQEIAISTRQNANMTLSRDVPGTLLYKLVLLAATQINDFERTGVRVPHVDLNRYSATTCTGTVPIRNLLEPLKVLCWVLGNPNLSGEESDS
jgi:hypothetical protein